MYILTIRNKKLIFMRCLHCRIFKSEPETLLEVVWYTFFLIFYAFFPDKRMET